MAAEIELKKINEYVQECLAITSITGSYVYGIDSNGNSIKIAVEVLASAGTDYSQQIAELTTKCNNNTTLITALQSAVNGKANAVHTHQQSDIAGLTTALEGKAAAAHTHAQSDITGLTTALNGKANAVHSHQQSDIIGLSDALAGKAAAVHTHNQSDITGLTAALEGKADTDHTHAIADVEGLQNSLANINSRIDEIDGGGVGNALRQEDLTTYTDAKSGDVIQNLGDDTAALHKYFIYECTEGSTVKTIPSGTRCLRLVQGSSVFISDQEVDANTDKFILYYRPTVDGVTYNFFGFATLGDTERAKLVGTYVVTDGGETFQITDVTASGNNITAIVLDNGVTLPISGQTPTRSTQALLTFYASNGVEYYGTVGDCTLCSKDIVSNVAGTQSYLIATAPIGTLFGAQTDIFTASEDIVFKSVTWTQRNVQPPTSVASGDNFLSITNDELGVSIDIAYNSTNQHLELKGKNSAVVSYVDMSQFIVDGMLDDVQLYTTAEQGVTVEVPYLKFTFNVASGKSVIRVSLKDLVDIYDGANINLTSAFVKAATYSAPAIGDSMNVAIGKLLKGHEDNATAIAGKQDTLTFDDAPITGSNNPVKSGGIKTAIDAVAASAAQGLKCVDLTTYSGGVNGEIVKHTGADTAQYTNGWEYKYTSFVIPSGSSYIDAREMTKYEGEIPLTVYLYQNTTRGKWWIYSNPSEAQKVSGFVYAYNDDYMHIGALVSTAAKIGTAFKQVVGVVTAVSDAGFTYEYDGESVTIPYSNRYGSSSYDERHLIDIFNPSTLLYLVNSGTILMSYDGGETFEMLTYNNSHFADIGYMSSASSDIDLGSGWQQWNSQPSSASDVSALQQRMTAAETAISGKQATITGAASTITTANLTPSKVLGSDANGKVAATSIATTDAEDAVAKRHVQNTDTLIKSPNGNVKIEATNNGNVSTGAIFINGGLTANVATINGNASVTGNLSVSGNLNVTGKETVEEIVNIKSENNFITLRDGAQTAIASGSISGTKVENYDGLGNDLLFGTDASGVFRIGDDGGTLEPIATRDESANLTDGQLMKWDAANQRLVGTSDIAPQINSYVASKAMPEDEYWDLVTAGTVQADTLYITYDNDYSED